MSLYSVDSSGSGEALASSTASSTTWRASLSMVYGNDGEDGRSGGVPNRDLFKIPLPSGLSINTYLDLCLGRHAEVKDPLLQAGDGVACRAHVLDLLTRTISGARIGHGVTTVAIGDHLNHDRALAGTSPLLGVTARLAHGEDVHAVNL
ncbi:hypothetical protein BC936DRAFT_136914 [Jimgerdemannia flammicorona]|uniref:Uncharacterized protein n=1 Tax=Jimgerdemannia flammicorona TaxID=994334 RepID=A0A433CYI8_9FUNG|nr:hypothetical protein BC936DRAFT_136914 [Jimgerdemannia flammicorona]